MEKIYGAIKNAITGKMIKSAASTLSEDENKVSRAIDVLVPSQLLALLKLGANNKHSEDILKDAGRLKLFSKKEQLFEGSGIVNGVNIGERFENALFGSQNSAVPEAISKESGLTHESADRLSNWTAGLIAGYLGDRMSKDKISFASLIKELHGERDTIMKDVPDKVAETLKLSACDIGSEENHPTCNPEMTRNKSWIWWLLVAILVIIAIVLMMRSCRNRREVMSANALVENTERIEAAKVTTNVVNDRQKTEITLDNGKKITVYKGGAEEQMLDYLKSGKYKTATANDLSSVWYHFDGIDFEFDSADKLMAGSMTQLENLAEILKQYPDAKIRIGGYADKKGANTVNSEISKQRADYIKSVFVKNGITANRVSTEGFGEEFATIPADASDAARAIDRSIALRFVK